MNDVAASLVGALLRTTAFLTAAWLLGNMLLRLTSASSPRLHRAVWIIVLLQGWLFARFAVNIPWHAVQESQRPIAADSPDISKPAEPVPRLEVVAERRSDRLIEKPAGDDQPLATLAWNWQTLLVLTWLTGGVLVVLRWVSGYLRFLHSVPLGEPAPPDEEATWQRLLAERNIQREIPMRMTDDLGPMLCRFESGYRLLVPRSLWRNLSPEARVAVLRHELAHYERGDIWKSLVARLLALPHWFNPFAWRAVRSFDEAAEWACDDEVRRACPDSVPFYGKALLALGAARAPHGFLNTAAQGRGLALRIQRILTPRELEDSRMKTACLIVTSVALLLAGGLRVKLIAQDAASDEAAQGSDEARPSAAKLNETWSKTIPVADPPDAKFGNWRVWVQQGWLLAERRSGDDEVEWKVVLAKVIGDEPPEIVVNRPPGEIRVTRRDATGEHTLPAPAGPLPGTLQLSYRDGRYFVRDGVGCFRCFRESKAGKSGWPELEAPARDANVPSNGAAGSDSSLLRGQVSNSWITVAAGPKRERGKPDVADCLVRLAHEDLKVGMRFTGGLGVPAKVTCGEWSLIDDGTLLLADRIEPWRLKGELSRRAALGRGRAVGGAAGPGRVMAVRSRATPGAAMGILTGSPAPELSGEVWLNSQQPLKWSDLRGKLVLLVLFDLRQPSFVPLIPPLLAFQRAYGEKGLAVIGVHQSCPRDEVEKRLAEAQIKFPVLIDDGQTGPHYILGFSSSFLIDRDGKVVSSYKDLLVPPTEIDKLLEQKDKVDGGR